MRDMEKKRKADRERMRALRKLGDRPSDLALRLRLAERKLAEAEEAERQRAALRSIEVDVPTWLVSPSAPSKGPGVPSLFLSDWHCGEVVEPRRIGGRNAFNKAISEERVRRLTKTALDLTFEHMVKPAYPGLVLPVGGDMLSGNIHEELTVTNWSDVRQVLNHAAGMLVWVIEQMATRFDRIFVPWVTGNHGRMTHKMQNKRRVGTSFDAILGDRVAEHFARDRNITFAISEGTSVLYSVYGHRYLLAHGDPSSIGVHGGDGIIGAVGPIVRGFKKLLARNSQVGMDFDTLVLGHYHQRMNMHGVIVNGSLKGYDEYAWGAGFPYEPPSQNLWFTHPKHGITAFWPVYLHEPRKTERKPWLTVFNET